MEDDLKDLKSHYLYLEKVLSERFINRIVYEASIGLLEKMPDMPIPMACTGPDGRMLYSWDNKQHHFEAEFFPDGKIEFFSMDRKTNEDNLHIIEFKSGKCFPDLNLDLKELKERFSARTSSV